MNRITILLLSFICLVTTFSCEKVTMASLQGDEIVFALSGDEGFVVDQTKTSAVNSLPGSLYWGTTTGGNATGTANEAAKWGPTTGTVSSSKIYTGKYQTYSPTAYNHYVSNISFTVNANTSVSASNGTDVIVGRATQDNTSAPSITMTHIFARTGTLTMNTQSGYTISGISWTIKANGGYSGTAGTYSLRQGAWTGVTTGLGSTAISSSSDLYLIPGSYIISCTYTLSKGDWTKSFTKSATVTLVGGKVNNITGNASGGEASEITVGVSLAAWSSKDHSMSIS